MGVEQARAAYDAHAWPDARTAYASVNEPVRSGRDLEQWGLAAFLTGELEEAERVRERAHHAYLAEGDRDGASRTAFWIALTATFRGDHAQAAGWFALMREAQGAAFETSVWRGYALCDEAMRRLMRGDADDALRLATELRDVATAHDDIDLRVFAGNAHGQALLATGDIAGGLTELDATMVLATTGRVTPQAVGIVYCAIVANCKACLDVERSIEWTRVLDRWCASQPGLVPFQGACVVHRSEVQQLRGDWAQAGDEVDGLIAHPGPNRNTLGEAHYQRAELHRLRGEHAAAEADYRLALACGKEPQPGLALLRSAQGRAVSALLALRRTLEEHRPQQLCTALVRAMVEVALAAGDVATAHEASARLTVLADASDAAFLRAAAAMARGQVALATGDPQDALGALRSAQDGFAEAEVPHDLARCRVLVAAAYAALGDHEAAALERDAARTTFATLGALPDLAALDGADGSAAVWGMPGAPPLTPREIEILTIVATGATNRAIAERLVLSEKTVARHVANIFTKLDVSNRATATAWAHEHGLLRDAHPSA